LFKQYCRLSCIGKQRVWGQARLLVALRPEAQGESLAAFLQSLLDVQDLCLAFSTGTPGHYRKTTAQVMSKDGRVIAYAKIASTQQARRMLMQEGETLRHLAELHISAGHIPRFIYAGPFHKYELLVQSAPSEKARRGPKQLDIRHIEFLAEIFDQTAIWKPFVDSDCWLRAKKSVEKLQDRISDDWRQRLQNGLETCQSELAKKAIPTGLCHGDFVPWNNYLVQGRLYVFDWEYAMEDIAFWDIFHFVSFPAMLLARLQGKSIINLWWGKKLKPFLRQYSERIGLGVELVPVCFLFYLIEVSCFYLDMFDRDGIQDMQRQHLQKTWAEMLDELTIHWERYGRQWG